VDFEVLLSEQKQYKILMNVYMLLVNSFIRFLLELIFKEKSTNDVRQTVSYRNDTKRNSENSKPAT
jgi:hypothetical protein